MIFVSLVTCEVDPLEVQAEISLDLVQHLLNEQHVIVAGR